MGIKGEEAEEGRKRENKSSVVELKIQSKYIIYSSDNALMEPSPIYNEYTQLTIAKNTSIKTHWFIMLT